MKFTPVVSDKKSRLYQLRMTERMFQDLDKAAKEAGLAKQELIRQLIEFGLKDMERQKQK